MMVSVLMWKLSTARMMSAGSLGMINLRERTELVNGVLNVQSAPGKGTKIQVAIPITEEAADRLHHAAGKR